MTDQMGAFVHCVHTLRIHNPTLCLTQFSSWLNVISKFGWCFHSCSLCLWRHSVSTCTSMCMLILAKCWLQVYTRIFFQSLLPLNYNSYPVTMFESEQGLQILLVTQRFDTHICHCYKTLWSHDWSHDCKIASHKNIQLYFTHWTRITEVNLVVTLQNKL